MKTRLAPAIGLEGAARLHRAFVDHTIDVVRSSGLPFKIALGADPDGTFTATLRARGLRVTPQCGGDLGARLEHELLGGPGRRVVIGTDCMVLRADWLHRAVARARPIALGPTEDGGYWGIAMERSAPAELVTAALRGIPWSTATVLSTTVARCTAAGVSPALLPTAWDVDEPPELTRLLAHAQCPPRVRALLHDLRPS